jgi:hypothetical protein
MSTTPLRAGIRKCRQQAINVDGKSAKSSSAHYSADHIDNAVVCQRFIAEFVFDVLTVCYQMARVTIGLQEEPASAPADESILS